MYSLPSIGKDDGPFTSKPIRTHPVYPSGIRSLDEGRVEVRMLVSSHNPAPVKKISVKTPTRILAGRPARSGKVQLLALPSVERKLTIAEYPVATSNRAIAKQGTIISRMRAATLRSREHRKTTLR